MKRGSRRPRWYERFAPATASLVVGDQNLQHRVTWRRGRLVLHDHDIAAEAVLQALGGSDSCACLLLLDILRGKLERGRGRLQMRGGWTSYTAAMRRSPQAQSFMQRLRSQPAQQRQPLLARLVAHLDLVPAELDDVFSQAESLHRDRLTKRVRVGDPRKPTPEQALEAAVSPAIEQAMRACQQFIRPHSPISIGCWKEVAGEPPVLQGNLTRRGGFVALALPIRWLNWVWCRGLAVVDDHFVLDVHAPAPETNLRAHAIRWEQQLGGHAIPVATSCIIRRHDGAWHLRPASAG